MEEAKTYLNEIMNKCQRNYLKKFGYDLYNLSEEDKAHINTMCPAIIYSGYYEQNLYLTIMMYGV